MGIGETIVEHTIGLKTPGKGLVGLILGIVNILLPGIGVIIAGAIDGGEGGVVDIIIGLIQLVTCWLVIGWIWAIVWGILMIIRNLGDV
eukprot:m51a1_g2941 hypothetical protein (89) ;mRNA; f:603055-603754